MNRILIGVSSPCANAERRQRIANTWFLEARELAIDAVFLLGVSIATAAERSGDLLLLPCADTVAGSLQQVQWFCRWALKQTDWEYLFICDDETIVCAENLAHYEFRERDYIGIGKPETCHCLLSRKAAQVVAESLMAQTAAADGLSCALTEAGIFPCFEPSLVTNAQTAAAAFRDNGQIIAVRELGDGILERIRAHREPSLASCDGSLEHDFAQERGELRAKTRIVMPTSNDYVEASRITLDLLEEYWPDHPPVDVVGRNQTIDAARYRNVRVFQSGLQSRVTWTDSLRWYLEKWSCDEIVLILLDDYGLFCQPDWVRLHEAHAMIAADPRVASFHLTHMGIPSSECYETNQHAVGYPTWTYTINLQAAFWRTTKLLRILQLVGANSADEFETHGSDIHNAQFAAEDLHLTFPSAADTPLFLDSDPHKSQWVLPYHNLMHRGNWDERYQEFREQYRRRTGGVQ